MSRPRATRAVRALPTPFALGALAGLAATPGVYAVLRVVSALAHPEPNPVEVLWSAHSGYVWRLVTAAYVAGLFGATAGFVATRRPLAVARAASVLLFTGALALAAQGLLLP